MTKGLGSPVQRIYHLVLAALTRGEPPLQKEVSPRLKPRSPSAARCYRGGRQEAGCDPCHQPGGAPTNRRQLHPICLRPELLGRGRSSRCNSGNDRESARLRSRVPVMLHWFASKLAEAHFGVHLS